MLNEVYRLFFILKKMNRENYITRGKGNKNYMKTNLQKENTAKVNQITEGVIWKQLLLFFFPQTHSINQTLFSPDLLAID